MWIPPGSFGWCTSIISARGWVPAPRSLAPSGWAAGLAAGPSTMLPPLWQPWRAPHPTGSRGTGDLTRATETSPREVTSLRPVSHLHCDLLPRYCWALHQASGTAKQGEQTLAMWHSCSRIIKIPVFLLSLSANRPGAEQISRSNWLDEPEEGSRLVGLPRALQQGPVPAPHWHRMVQRMMWAALARAVLTEEQQEEMHLAGAAPRLASWTSVKCLALLGTQLLSEQINGWLGASEQQAAIQCIARRHDGQKLH